MATENLLMAAVKAGGDRQDLHERIRVHSLAAAGRLKDGAAENDLIDRIRTDPAFPAVDFDRVLDPRGFIGRSARQVEEFITREIEPIRRRYPDRRPADEDSEVRSLAGETLRCPAADVPEVSPAAVRLARFGAGGPCVSVSVLHGDVARWVFHNRLCGAFPCEVRSARKACGSGEPPPEWTRRHEPLTSPQAKSPFPERRQINGNSMLAAPLAWRRPAGRRIAVHACHT